jgi:hypothetical protein
MGFDIPEKDWKKMESYLKNHLMNYQKKQRII